MIMETHQDHSNEHREFMPLPAHPPPKRDDTIFSWMKKLANANECPMKVMFAYVTNRARERGFLEALHLLTRVPIETISMMDNEFRDEFWKYPKQCPFKECDYTTRKKTSIIKHLNKKHWN